MNKFSLLENASDSLSHAVEHLKPIGQSETSDWKRVIVDLAHVVELLLKEKLRSIHPAFVYSDVDKFPSNNPHTVSAALALQRLQKVGGIKLSKEDVTAITSAREKRNEIEHFEFSINTTEAQAVVGQTLSFIFRFLEKHLDENWRPSHLSKKHWYVFYGYQDFYKSLVSEAQKKIKEGELATLECGACHNDAFVIEEELCFICSHKEQVDDCKNCGEPYLYSGVGEGYEEAEICKECEWKDGYAAAHCEKY